MSLWTACQQKREENLSAEQSVVPLYGVDDADDDALSPGITSQQFLKKPVHRFTVTANFAKSAQICRDLWQAKTAYDDETK